MSGKMKTTPVTLYRSMVKLITQMHIYLGHFPKYEKYALNNQIRNVMLDIYNLITECNKKYYKTTSLTNLDIKHEQLRMLINLAYELNYFKFKDGKNNLSFDEANRKYLFISGMVDVIGKQIGGWIKHQTIKSRKNVED